MGFWDTITDLAEAAMPWATVEAEAPAAEEKACAPAKHHYDECVERVTAAADSEEGAKEDCVEEFFHLAHCATQCAAPKLWAKLK
ncbi:cytochrome b-c1 complex subunit 6 [Colletotrichum liriopes]|uniref:Cytochrome b-c1 complex subunit 6 n=1 Tax=Colletotrichum liriopes TaxID=708192 RepID=A0AA37LYU4_9PEZI|nr:cytochrome b-c1 complex subunit 6 [Colletotrichum liriopes]